MTALGKAWRILWWVLFPPIGAWMSWRAGIRRRHRESLAATRQAHDQAWLRWEREMHDHGIHAAAHLPGCVGRPDHTGPCTTLMRKA